MHHNEMSEAFAAAAEEEMRVAGEEEKRLAIEREDIIDGIPHIPVITDEYIPEYISSRPTSPRAFVKFHNRFISKTDVSVTFRVRVHTKVGVSPYTDLNVSTAHENPIPQLLTVSNDEYTGTLIYRTISNTCKNVFVERWKYIEKMCSIPREEFIIAIKFVMNSTYFTFDDICYQQTFGTPMGSPLSPVIADVTFQDLENRAVAALPLSLPFYIRYVDDVALAAPSAMFHMIVNTFNSYHPRLQFTIEEGDDNRLNFLDVTIISHNELIYFNWFQKQTFSGRYLHFESRHPLCHKRSISLTDKVLRFSHPRFITVEKDRLHIGAKINIVYKINCANCNASYVGQTGRLLNTRIKEHKKNHTSVIANHKS
ncbi:uncharacterized protein [Anoplolepis gracilipes]|uniref:uncharacterized protein n=1 Tax=Anoplolepis gracilipes TaxID=354296 RepID=UPI003B9F36B4